MNTQWNRLLALILVLALGLTMTALAQEAPAPTEPPAQSEKAAEEAPADDADTTDDEALADDADAPDEAATQNTLPTTHTPLTPAAQSFTFVKPKRAAIVKYYTAIRLEGIEPTIYMFVDKEGATQFRVYGHAPDAKRGFYEAKVTAIVSDAAGGWDFTLDVPGTKPIKDARVFALYKGKNLAKEDVPAGLRKGNGTGMYYFFNVFGKRESVAWASPDGNKYAWYLPNGSKPLAGSPQLNPDAFAARMHKEGDKYYRIPKELNAGYAKEVIITTSDGKTAQVMTDKPVIDTDNLKTR